jgi:hypothetical protein
MNENQDPHAAAGGVSGLSAPQAGGLAKEPSEVPPEQAALLIRDAANQLKEFLTERRRESEELSRRIARIESDLERSRESGGQLKILSIVVAVLGFIVTTALWRAVQQAQKVNATLEQTIGAVESSGKSSLDGIMTLRGDLAEQARTAERVEKSVATARELGDKSLEELAAVKRELAAQIAAADRLQKKLDAASEEITGDLAEQSEETEAARKAMLADLKGSIARIEAAIEQRTTELTTQREQAEAATERLQSERQAMIREATRSVSLQLAGLKEILNGLEGETEDGPPSPGTPQAASPAEKESPGDKKQPAAAGRAESGSPKASQKPPADTAEDVRPAAGGSAKGAASSQDSPDAKNQPPSKKADGEATDGEKGGEKPAEQKPPAVDRPAAGKP